VHLIRGNVMCARRWRREISIYGDWKAGKGRKSRKTRAMREASKRKAEI